jgi:hypothetical protein
MSQEQEQQQSKLWLDVQRGKNSKLGTYHVLQKIYTNIKLIHDHVLT